MALGYNDDDEYSRGFTMPGYSIQGNQDGGMTVRNLSQGLALFGKDDGSNVVGKHSTAGMVNPNTQLNGIGRFFTNWGPAIEYGVQGLAAIGSIMGARKQYSLGKKSLALQREFAERNLANQTQAYNTALENRARREQMWDLLGTKVSNRLNTQDLNVTNADVDAKALDEYMNRNRMKG